MTFLLTCTNYSNKFSQKNAQAGGEVSFRVSYDEENSLLKLKGLRTENLLVGDNLCVMCRVLLTRKNRFFETVEVSSRVSLV